MRELRRVRPWLMVSAALAAAIGGSSQLAQAEQGADRSSAAEVASAAEAASSTPSELGEIVAKQPPRLTSETVTRFDPTAAAMQALFDVYPAELRAALSDTAERVAPGGAEISANSYSAVLDAMDAAREDLYESVGRSPQGQVLRDEFLACLDASGYSLTHDEAEAIDEVDDKAMSDAWLACDDQVAPRFDELVKAAVPEWVARHEATLRDYGRAIGITGQ